MKQTYLILGATSGIAKAVARALAAAGHDLILAGRNAEELERLCQDVAARHSVQARPLEFDAAAPAPAGAAGSAAPAGNSAPAALVAASTELNDGALVDGVILAYAVMYPQQATETDAEKLAAMLQVNFVTPACQLQAFANAFAQRGSGVIVGISSVAGDRGRGSNFHYGSTKAGLSAFLDGLRHRLHGTGVTVCTVKPGFVATPMTHGIVNPDSPLCASPEQVAKDILRAIAKKKPTLYTLWPWRWVMFIIRHLPERIFLRTKL